MRPGSWLALLVAVGCGGSGGGAPASADFQITAAGVTPVTVTIASSGHVSFVNKDAAAHQITSSCGALQSPSLATNATFTSAPIAGPATCTFSDALNPANSAFNGTVNVSAPAPGY